MEKNRANWNESRTKTFLDLCIEQKNLFNWNEKGLTKHGWHNVYPKFRQLTGLHWDNKQLHNKLSQLRFSYSKWRDLQNRTGLGRNKETGGVAADDSYWQYYDEADTSAAAENHGNPPKFLEELQQLFGRTTQDRGVLLSAGGVRGTTPSYGNDDPLERTPSEHFEQSSDRDRSKRPMRDQTVDSPRKKKSTSIETYMKDISEAVTRRSRKSMDDVDGQDDVRQMLEADGTPEGSDLYLRALYLCKTAVNRKQFLGMSTRNGREQWINFNWDAMCQFHRRCRARGHQSMELSSQEELNNSDTSSDGSLYELAGLGAALGAYAAGRYCEPPPLGNPNPPLIPHLTGRQWVELNLHDRLRCYSNFRMIPEDFIHLHRILVANHGLQSTQQFDGVEALAMFVWACGTGQSFRNIKDRFDRSFDTISRKMGHVLNCMFSFAQVVVAPNDATYSQLHPRLHRYSPFFDGCIGALDGTHIRARTKQVSRLDYLNRKGWTSFNVLGIVDLDMRFTYVGAGRAGSCHDMSVLRDCMETPNFPHPPRGRYYLVDLGYAIRQGYLGPYRSTRYHLDEFSQRGAETSEEKFNYHHASIHNVVERTFGVLKSRWHILREIPFYRKDKQIQIIIACCALHNYLVQLGLSRCAQPTLTRPPDEASTMWVGATASDDMSTVRDWISLGVSCM